MEQIITSGKSKQEAIEIALGKLGLKRANVRVEVLEEGSRGFLGFGGRETKVRVTRSDGTGPLPENMDAEAVTRAILEPLGIDYKLDVRREEDGFFIKVNCKSDDGLLIGRRGQTLDAIKHLVQRILSSQAGQPVSVNFEVGDYRERREEALREKAEAVAKKVLESGKSLSLEPMTAQDRRIVHMSLAERKDVRTYTTGEGSRRRVIIALASDSGDEDVPEEPAVQDETISPYADIPDPSFRSTAVSKMAKPRQNGEDSNNGRGERHGRGGVRERSDRPQRDRSVRGVREERREPVRSENVEEPREAREAQRRGRRHEGPREEGGTRIRKTFRREQRGAPEEERTPPRSQEHVERPAVVQARDSVKVEDAGGEKPFSSNLAKSILGLEEGSPGAKAAKKRRYR